MLDSKYSISHSVLPSECDASGRISYPDVFKLFMDIASLHAEDLQVGSSYSRQYNRFWLTVRSRVRFLKRPYLLQAGEVSTRIQPSRDKRCDREYSLNVNGKVCAYGVTEWAMMDLNTRQLVDLSNVYPEGLDCNYEPYFSDGYHEFSEEFNEEYQEYTVRSTDIDFGGHMNNIAYVRMIFSLYSVRDIVALPISEIETVYPSSALENEVLKIHTLKKEGEILHKAVRPNGKTAFLMRILLTEKQ